MSIPNHVKCVLCGLAYEAVLVSNTRQMTTYKNLFLNSKSSYEENNRLYIYIYIYIYMRWNSSNKVVNNNITKTKHAL